MRQRAPTNKAGGRGARVIREHRGTALEFLRALSPLDGLFPADYRGQQHIFRGLGSAKYRLEPAAFREGVVLRWYQNPVVGPRSSVKEQIRAELRTLMEFFKAADRQGLRLPEDSQDVRTLLSEFDSVKDTLFDAISRRQIDWPPTFMLSLMALAQHHGVPTRLLDWSWDPYIAAYFAASSAVIDGAPLSEGDLCVWAFHLVHDEVAELTMKPRDRKLVLVRAPAADNDHLRAQRWVGLVYRDDSTSLNSPLLRRSYDELADESFGSVPIFWQLTLPRSEAGEILRLLAAHGVDAASVFPGFSGAARSVHEMSHWPLQSEWNQSGRPKKYRVQSEEMWHRHAPDTPPDKALPPTSHAKSKSKARPVGRPARG